MSRVPIQIIRNGDDTLASAHLRTDLPASTLMDVEREWGPIRRAAATRLLSRGLPPEQIPRHWHWDWGAKSAKLTLLACRCFGIECDGKMQGLLMVLTGGYQARLPPDFGKPLVYVDYIESAPWNVAPLVDAPLYSGIGVMLIRAAVQLSMDEGFHGRVGLHSLPQSEGFYRDKCGMTGCGPDLHYQSLPYYEMTREQAQRFI